MTLTKAQKTAIEKLIIAHNIQCAARFDNAFAVFIESLKKVNKNYQSYRESFTKSFLVQHETTSDETIIENFIKGLSVKRNTLEFFILRYGEDHGRFMYEDKNARCAITLENLIKKHGEEVGRIKYEETNAAKAITLENLIKKYGKEEGEKRFNQYREKQAYSNTLEYKAKLHGWREEDYNKFNKSRAITLDNLIQKYGEEEGTSRFNDYCEKQKIAGNSLEYFIDLLGEEAGREKYEEVNAAKANTLANFIKRHGEEEGNAKFIEYMNKNSGQYSSKLANDFFERLTTELDLSRDNVYYNENELPIITVDGNVFLYDYHIKGSAEIIEFHGDYWHANPKKYLPSDTIQYPSDVYMLAEEVWEKDKKKIDTACDLGYNILVIWESDVNNDLEGELERAKRFINKHQ